MTTRRYRLWHQHLIGQSVFCTANDEVRIYDLPAWWLETRPRLGNAFRWLDLEEPVRRAAVKKQVEIAVASRRGKMAGFRSP